MASDPIAVRDLVIIAAATATGSTAAGGKPTTTLLTASGAVIAAIVAALTNSRLQTRKAAEDHARDAIEDQRTTRQARMALAREILVLVRAADDVRAAAGRGVASARKAAKAASALRNATDLAATHIPYDDMLTSILEELAAVFDDLCSASADELADVAAIYDVTHNRLMRTLRPPRDEPHARRRRFLRRAHDADRQV